MEHKKILIVGLGLSGVSACKYFSQQENTQVIVTDKKNASQLSPYVEQVKGLNVKLILGEQPAEIFLESDLIILSPGASTYHPLIVKAKEKGIRVTSEISIALSLIQKPVICITGTNGKTTTTSLIGEILKEDGRSVFVGGNIGKPLLDYVIDHHQEDYVVAEISSFQLETIESFTPKVAVFTNIEPDHLDRYPDFSAYVYTKKKMLFFCDESSFIVLNADNPKVAEFGNDKIGKTLWFSSNEALKDKLSAYIDTKNKIILAKALNNAEKMEETTFDISQFKLFGIHNKENLAAAICATQAIGVKAQAIQNVIQKFKPVEHRLEFVRKKDGVFFINDSKGTNVMSVARSLAAFPYNPIILIAGGKEKGADFSILSEAVRQQVKVLILMGEAKEVINRMLGDYTETYLVGTFEEAVLLSFQKSRIGDIVLLSPGCASFDMFKDYQERGAVFKKLVCAL